MVERVGEEESLRVAAAVVGATGALIGAAKGAFSILLWVLMWIRLGDGVLNSHTYLLWGTNAALVASCIVALSGAVRTGLGSPRAGGMLLLAGVAGVVALMVLFVVLQAAVLAPRIPGMPTSPGTLFYVAWLAPMPLLLLAAALALFAHPARERTSTGL